MPGEMSVARKEIQQPWLGEAAENMPPLGFPISLQMQWKSQAYLFASSS